ncbi:MAG: hypothetical protein IKR48_02390 [Kiritimatiellae bacterium]|nr:hypothetical protein [Kiritimatiellia bacterium]
MATTATETPILFGSAARQFIASPPLSDSVTVHIPKEYQAYSLEVIVLPITSDAAESLFFPKKSEESIRKSGKRKLGGFEKGFYMAPDFDAPLEEFAEYM